MNSQSMEDFWGSENNLHDIIVKTHRMFNARENSKVNSGLGMVMTCQHRLKICTILVADVRNGGGYTYIRAEGMWEACLILL